MPDRFQWKIDEDEEQAGKQLILSREDVYGFNEQREGHGSLWFIVFAILAPLALVIILALLIHLFAQDAKSIAAPSPFRTNFATRLVEPQQPPTSGAADLL